MRIKLRKNADREWVTTTKGNIVRKTNWVEFDESDRELDNFMNMGLFVVEGKEEYDDELIKVKEENKKLKEEILKLKSFGKKEDEKVYQGIND